MDFPLFSLLGLAAGLSMDCAAVAAVRGFSTPRLRWRNVLWMSGMFGGFQALMPVLGFLLGASLGPLVERWDHWIVFFLLTGIGGKMLHEAARGEEEEGDAADPFRWGILFGLAVATSIDSFAAGIVLPMLGAPLFLSVTLIGATAFALTAFGLWAGRRFGALLGRRLDALGGLVLIGLAVKTLVEHL